jgi:hypothetical protein
MVAFNRLLGRSMGLFGCLVASTLVACSGAGPVDGNVDESTRAEREATQSAAAEGGDRVRVTGTIESAVFESATPLPVLVAGADVCVTVSGVATCTTSDEGGRYSLSLSKTDETGLLSVTHDDYATTTTTLSLQDDVSHSLGVMPTSRMPAGGSVILVRSFVYVEEYIMTVVGPGIEVQVSIGGTRTALVTGRDGFAMFDTETAGAVDVAASAQGVSCDVWGGNVTAIEPTVPTTNPGGVTEVDVICRMARFEG